MRKALSFAFFLLVLAAAGVALTWWLKRTESGKRVKSKVHEVLSRDETVRVPEIPWATASRVIYLNREGARLTGKRRDDASKNLSSVVAVKGKKFVDFPPYTGSHSGWKSLVKCVRSKLSAFDVNVVDRRPVEGSYMMVMIGGRPRDVSAQKKGIRITGIAPFNGDPIRSAVVMVFARQMRNNVRAMCETAGHEIAHAYGLDHGYHCRDLMTYLKHCGKRVYLDRSVACGEYRKRKCAGGEPTQNSYRELLAILGKRRK